MKKLRSIIVGMFLVLAAAVPVFAVDGYFSGPSLCTGSSSQVVKIYGNHVIVKCNGSYVLHDIEKNTSTELPSTMYTAIDMSGNVIIYKETNQNNKFMKYVISTGNITTIKEDVPNVWYSDARIDGNRVVWAYQDYNTWVDGIQVYDIVTGQTTTIITTNPAIGEGNLERASIHGDKLIYTKAGLPYMYDLIENKETSLGLPLGYNLLFEIDSKYIYAQESSSVIKTYEIATGIVDTFTITNMMYALSFHDGKIYFANNQLNPSYHWRVYQYDVKTKTLSMLMTPSNTEQWDQQVYGDKVVFQSYVRDTGSYDIRVFNFTPPSKEVYSVNATSNTVTVINPYRADDFAYSGDDRIVATISTGAGPSDTALSPDETKLYILNSTAKSVTMAQTHDFTPVYTVNINPTNKQTATAVAGDNDSNTYVALKSSTGAGVVKKITSAGAATTLTVGTNPNGLKISLDNKKLLVSNGSSSNVTAIDLATFTIIEGNIATGAGPKIVRP